MIAQHLSNELQNSIEIILFEVEVDEMIDQDFGELYRLWYRTTLIGTFYQKIFSNEWIATPIDSIHPYHCKSEDDAKYWLVAHYLQAQRPVANIVTKKALASTSLVIVLLFAQLNSYKAQISECTYRGSERREGCL